jgi:tRNA-specific 2-thiouridylase
MDLLAFEHHLASPQGLGTVPTGACTVTAGGGSCCDEITFSLAVEGERVSGAGFRAQGCGAATAAASAAVTLVRRAPVLEAARIGAGQVAGELGGLSPAKLHAAELAADALARALGAAVRARAQLRSPPAGRTLVAMSGGVDSAVALLRAAPNAIGVTLRLWLDPAGPSSERSCCSPAAVIAARETCHRLGLPHVTLDLREEFRAIVVGPFVEGYAGGLTPNPCMRCNGRFRFDALVDFTRRAGADVLWTGHYARIVERDGLRLIARGDDPAKDQSYMLATVDPALLDRVAFPLGGQGKRATRDEAAAAGLAAAERAESQEACFLAGDDYRTFLERQGLTRRPGPIVDEDGVELGLHDGVWRYTPGQRRGIGLATTEPVYALRADTTTNTLTVGPRSALEVREVSVRGRLYLPVERADVKLRYRSDVVPAIVQPTGDGFVLRFEQPAFAVAPGQVAVLYDDSAIVGAGVIVTATG